MFLVYGAHNIISKPTKEEEKEIIKKIKERKQKNLLELSLDDDESDGGG